MVAARACRQDYSVTVLIINTSNKFKKSLIKHLVFLLYYDFKVLYWIVCGKFNKLHLAKNVLGFALLFAYWPKKGNLFAFLFYIVEN